jgi:MerR family copper efflux transcriptional regulator
VRSAEIIRIGQALGLSLREIAGLRQERRKGKLELAGRIALMKSQLARLEAKAAELEKLRAYVKAKIAWQEGGELGPEPSLEGYL